MPGPPPKAPDRRQRRNKPPALALEPRVLSLVRKTPPVPDGFLKRTADLWGWYWESQVGSVASETTDVAQVELLFQMLDEHSRCFRTFRKHRLVEGSQGQSVINPLGRYCDRLRMQILAFAREIGLTPHAKMRLGISAVQAKKSLDQMNRELDADDDDAQDPRLTRAK